MQRLLIAFIAAAVLSPGLASAQDPAARGLEIMREVARRDSGWRDAQVTLTMVLQDRRGNSRKRSLRMLALEVQGEKGGDMSIAIFDSPPDLKGTLLLTHTRVGADDDQWLYLPALKRVKRISSSNKTGSFFGSEFTYEDISAPEIGKFTYRYLGNKPCGALTCFVVERTPAYRNSGYSTIVNYIDSSQYRPQRIEYFDRKRKLLKTLVITGYKKYAGGFWRARNFTMKNLKTGRTTVLQYGNWRFGTGLRAADFSKENLRNIR